MAPTPPAPKGTGTWNEETGPMKLAAATLSLAPAYTVRLHIRRRLIGADGPFSDYEAALQDLSDQAKRTLIAEFIRLLANDRQHDGPALDTIANELKASGSTSWDIRLYHDSNSAAGENGDYIEVSRAAQIAASDLAEARAYLEQHDAAAHPAGKKALETAFANDPAALQVLHRAHP